VCDLGQALVRRRTAARDPRICRSSIFALSDLLFRLLCRGNVCHGTNHIQGCPRKAPTRDLQNVEGPLTERSGINKRCSKSRFALAFGRAGSIVCCTRSSVVRNEFAEILISDLGLNRSIVLKDLVGFPLRPEDFLHSKTSPAENCPVWLNFLALSDK